MQKLSAARTKFRDYRIFEHPRHLDYRPRNSAITLHSVTIDVLKGTLAEAEKAERQVGHVDRL